MARLAGVWTILVCLAMLAPPVGAAQGKTRAVRTDARLAVQVAASGLGGLVAGTEDREEQVRLIREFVAASRFFPDGDGYFFVYDTAGVCVAHGAQPNLVGRNLLDYRDKNGFAVIRAIIEKGTAGGGYVEYLWPRPNVEGTFEKLAYVEPIPGTNFIIGAGLYFLDVW